ncbi:hypothetical protein [Chitinophaga vietnamensis]|uniref:hypothetical protein n=1 Tax=Chitinophaga vietnamensis TaxID=2593957 RepID=UPI001177F95C|nr:hypothetical protein [Chitinophaga vietnamensis]
MTSANFTLKFEYKGQPHILEVRAAEQQYKTVYKVDIQEQEITFEPDEEGFVRAVSSKPVHDHAKYVDVNLLHHVAELIIQHIRK